MEPAAVVTALQGGSRASSDEKSEQTVEKESLLTSKGEMGLSV